MSTLIKSINYLIIISVKTIRTFLILLFLFVLGTKSAYARNLEVIDIPEKVTLFKNVNIFDGKSDKLLIGYDVLVVKNRKKKSIRTSK